MSEKVLFGLIGEKLEHSFSPKMFNYYFRKIKLDYTYALFPQTPESLPEFLKKVGTSSIIGLNVTIPYKEAVIPYLDDIDEAAERISSINVIHNNKGRLKGYNTDYIGFGRALVKHPHVNLKSAIVLGAGGAARAVIYALHKLEFKKIIFFSRRKDKLEKILHNFFFISNLTGYLWQPEKIKEETQKTNLIINATPVGMHPLIENSPIDINVPLKENSIAFDLIYNPEVTKFLQLAKDRGAVIENGLGMLIYQALESIKIWINQTIDEELFCKTAQEVLNASFFKRR
jgi:shikimate dehydrogenase